MTRAYIEGLLPENAELREATVRLTGANANNPFPLLEKIGRDCPGAVQFIPEDCASSDAEGPLTPVNEKRIGRRLRESAADSGESWVRDDEHWSLGGQQAKFALGEEAGQWFEVGGSQATTHIFKPGIVQLRSQALVEHLTMRALLLTRSALAEAMPFPAIVESAFRGFEETPAIVITRYDRFRGDDGRIYRLHQEDFCQATSTMPHNKYVVTASDVVSVLRRTGTPEGQIDLFARGVLLNWLVAAPDGHAKNFSAILTADSAVLAPLHDVATGLGQRTAYDRLAMGIGGESRMSMIRADHVLRFGGSLKLDGDSLLAFAAASARVIAAAFTAAISEVEPSLSDKTLEYIRIVDTELTRYCEAVSRALG